MVRGLTFFPKFVVFSLLGTAVFSAVTPTPRTAHAPMSLPQFTPPDTGGPDTTLPFPFRDREGDFYTNPTNNPIDLNDPSVIDKEIVYDPVTGEFKIVEKIDGFNYRDPNYISFEQFLESEKQRLNEEYWKQRSEGVDLLGRGENVKLADLKENEISLNPFEGTTVEIRPKGNVELIFGGRWQNVENPTLPERARKQGGFDFDMNINMGVTGNIGDKVKLNTNYNTQATFDFENQVKLNYEGTEDEIVQSIEAGNVSFGLPTTLIQGSQTLFGIKTKLKFGRLTWTALMSQQKSKKENIQIEGGAQTRDFEITIDDYDENRHFFLGQYFRDHYEQFLNTMPVVNSPVQITRTEVWITNSTGYTQNTRDIVGFMDLGESDHLYNQSFSANPGPSIPYNGANTLYSTVLNTQGTRALNTSINTLINSLNMQPIQDFEKTRARKLEPSEYTLNPQLGFISLNQRLQPDEVLAVAYEFTYQGKTYRVGEFSQDIPVDPNLQNVLFLKMLKSTSARPKLPIWDLMMKNIYALGAYQVNPEDFRLDIYYEDPGGGVKRYIPEGDGIKSRPLIQVLNLDRLNNQLDPQPDGVFDFVPGTTINTNNGRVIFPVVEPFGSFLKQEFLDNGNSANLAEKYVYPMLYDSTKVVAQQFPQFNRFVLKGRYKSSVSSEIYLGAFNIPRGSVTISAGGQQLKEGIDYTIDYNLGRVKIINDGILNSGVPINVSFENNNTFGFQVKTMWGNRFDYWINDNFTIGATQLHLSERPYTQKVNFGDDPISNSIYGADVNYNTDLPVITKFLDRIPTVETEAMSSMQVTAEGAYFKPGHSKAINQDQGNKGGYVYIDDFEGTRSAYDLKFPSIAWQLASTPQGAVDEQGKVLFPEAGLFDSLPYGYNRSKLIWYNLDPVFQSNNSATPTYIKNNPSTQSSHYVRIIDEREIFERDNPNLLYTQLATFDLAYYPTRRGPYNYLASANGIPGVAAGLNQDGSLKAPETRWGGIMRSLETNDFENANVEYIDFWLMDPFDNTGPNPNGDGEMYIDLGNVSEDILKDSRKFFENGLPKPGTDPKIDTTKWGKVPRTQAIVNAFDTDPDVLRAQDVGLDGLTTEEEKQFHSDFINAIDQMVTSGQLTQAVADSIKADPSSDDFQDYLDPDLKEAQLGILERYEHFDGAEGNTVAGIGQNTFSHGSNLPNSEDLNQDNTLNETEEYYQYRIPMYQGMDVDNHPYITDVVSYNAEFRNGQQDEVNWYHFRIPIEEFSDRVGGIQDFRSIRFIRMFLTGFDKPVVMRFARLELVRNQWRRYRASLLNPGEYIPNDNDEGTLFNVAAVSVEENSKKEPIPYVTPPGVEREEFIGNNTGTTYLQNEQSLQLEVCGLKDGDSKAVYKTLNFDFRQYERLQIFFHAETYTGKDAISEQLKDGEMVAFLRLGDDFTENYYEYALPLKVTKPDDVTGTEDERRRAIWPDENLIDLLLDSLSILKRTRNDQNVDPSIPFTLATSGGHEITIVGNPNLGRVKVAMIGLRNPKEANVAGKEICGEVWVNEFRLNGLNERGGGAGLVRTDIKLADLGSITLAGNFHTIGFGQLEQKINERYRDNFYQYDASTNLELGKLLPKSWALSIPMYAGISNSHSRPEFDPYDLDIKLTDKLNELSGTDQREYLKKVEDYSSIKSLNFTNVRKNKTGSGKAHLWDISNVNLTYAYTKDLSRSPIVEYDLIERQKGGLAYNYSASAKYIEPFKKLIPGKSKWFSLLRDFNFNPIPNRVSFRTELNRQYGELVLRDLYGDALLDTTYNKSFNWDRFYDLRWDLTKSLKLDFSAVNRARVDEPAGAIDTKEKKDSVWNNIKDFGRNIDYSHNITLNYNLPTNKLPIIDWVNARAAYATTYSWRAASLVVDSLGNTISNTRDIRLNADGNLTSLYNKIGFIKKATQPQRGGRPNRGGRDQESKTSSENAPENKDTKNEGEIAGGVRTLIDLVTMLKRVSVNYNRSEGSIIPGFEPDAEILGMGRNLTAPGWQFITGFQPDSNELNRYADNGWIVRASSLNFQHLQHFQENLDIKATVEPFKDMRIDINWKKSYTEDFAEFFRYDPQSGRYVHLNPIETGSYNISFMAVKTLFDNLDTANISETYRLFEANRRIVSNQLGQDNPYSTGTFQIESPFDTVQYPEYADGYGPYSQAVLIPSFIAAYTGKSIDEVPKNVFNLKPKPNWRFTYNGLARIKPFDKIFERLNITHGYNSTLTVNSFNSDFSFSDSNMVGFPSARDSISGNFYTYYSIPRIQITEAFAPLIGIDMTLQNGLTARFEYKKSRSLGLSMVDYQLIETKSTDMTLGMGYRIKGLVLPFKRRGKNIVLENELTFKFDFSFRDDLTNNYILDQNTSEATQGAKSWAISPSADYVINKRLSIRAFFDWKRTRPYTSASYPITNTNAGIALRFTLAE